MWHKNLRRAYRDPSVEFCHLRPSLRADNCRAMDESIREPPRGGGDGRPLDATLLLKWTWKLHSRGRRYYSVRVIVLREQNLGNTDDEGRF